MIITKHTQDIGADSGQLSVQIHGSDSDSWIGSMDLVHGSDLDQILGSDPWMGSMDLIHGSAPWIRSLDLDQIHGSDPWVRSKDLIHGADP